MKDKQKLDNILLKGVLDIVSDLDPKEREILLSEFNHFVVFYVINEEELKIYHIIGYELYPDENDILHNIEELRTDEEFKLDTDVLERIEYRVVKLEDYDEG